LLVLVAPRQPIARAGIRALVDEHPDLQVVGESSSADDAAQDAEHLQPDAILAMWDGARLGDALGLATLASMRDVPLVLLVDGPFTSETSGILRRGVRGVLLSDATGDEVHAALVAASQGLLVLDPELGPASLEAAVYGSADPIASPGLDEPLTDREREVLALLALGLPNKTIATRLAISEHTVKFHVGSILAKLGASSRSEALARAARLGLIAL
jgi:DNA-binding NarL/FixJ family response regulator